MGRLQRPLPRYSPFAGALAICAALPLSLRTQEDRGQRPSAPRSSHAVMEVTQERGLARNKSLGVTDGVDAKGRGSTQPQSLPFVLFRSRKAHFVMTAAARLTLRLCKAPWRGLFEFYSVFINLQEQVYLMHVYDGTVTVQCVCAVARLSSGRAATQETLSFG